MGEAGALSCLSAGQASERLCGDGRCPQDRRVGAEYQIGRDDAHPAQGALLVGGRRPWRPRKSIRSLAAIAKPVTVVCEIRYELMPTTRPQRSTSGPPLLPWEISAGCARVGTRAWLIWMALISPRVSTRSGAGSRLPWASGGKPRSFP